VEAHVEHLRTEAGRLHQFTAIDVATRYRVLTICDHAFINSAIDFVEELRRRLPVAIQRIKVVCSWFLTGARHAPFLLGLFGVAGGGATFGPHGLLVGAAFLVTLRRQWPSDHPSGRTLQGVRRAGGTRGTSVHRPPVPASAPGLGDREAKHLPA
jgi:hypothetical protein